MGRESKNQLLPTHPHHPMIYTGASSNGQRYSGGGQHGQQPRYSQLSNGYSNGGSVYYPGQRHPDMLPDDEALWELEKRRKQLTWSQVITPAYGEQLPDMRDTAK